MTPSALQRGPPQWYRLTLWSCLALLLAGGVLTLLSVAGQASKRTHPAICSHRGLANERISSHEDVVSDVAWLRASGVTCFDLDVSESGGIPVLAHPSEMSRTAHLVSLAAFLQSNLTGVSLTLEPKGNLAEVEGVLRLSSLLDSEWKRDKLLDLVLSPVVLNAVGSAALETAGVALPLRDRNGCDLAELDAFGGVAALPATVRVLMPSVACLRRADVREAISTWRASGRAVFQNSPPWVREVHAWIIDDCATLAEAASLGADRVISNYPIRLLRCT